MNSMLRGLAHGLNVGSERYAKLRMAREQLDMQEEKFQMDKKIGNLQLQKLELEADPEVVGAKKKLFMNQAKAAELDYANKKLLFDETEKRLKTGLEDQVKALGVLSKANPNFDFDYDGKTGNISIKSKKNESGNYFKLVDAASKMTDAQMGEMPTMPDPNNPKAKITREQVFRSNMEQIARESSMGAVAPVAGQPEDQSSDIDINALNQRPEFANDPITELVRKEGRTGVKTTSGKIYFMD